jgi:hypothetical protein
MSKHDPVNYPHHYTSHPSGVECNDITQHMGFNLGNALKYIWRADLKGDAIEDMEKARWYISKEIAKRRQAEAEQPDLFTKVSDEVPCDTSPATAPDRETIPFRFAKVSDEAPSDTNPATAPDREARPFPEHLRSPAATAKKLRELAAEEALERGNDAAYQKAVAVALVYGTALLLRDPDGTMTYVDPFA